MLEKLIMPEKEHYIKVVSVVAIRKGGEGMADKNQGQGQGWHGDSAGHAKAGAAGGNKTAKTHGREFYQQIGHEGGEKSPTKFKPNDPRTEAAARKGGKASGGNRGNNQND